MAVHVEADLLEEACGRDGGRCHVEGGPRLGRHTARRLACDATLVAVVEDRAGTVTAVSGKARTVPGRLRRALRARDGGCRFPGCPNRAWLDAHHVRHWADGGPTRLDNLALQCSRHHHLLHQPGWHAKLLPDATLETTDPNGRTRTSRPPGHEPLWWAA